jgi:CubicO group peptidase (beta-lactamase class C family)
MDVEIDPREAGFDPARLTRIDNYLRRYVDDQLLPGWQFILTRGGKVVHRATAGHRDRERAVPIGHDSLFRIYSMTKPVTSVAAMMLYERGAFQLNDPVSDVIRSFAEVRVYTGGSAPQPATVPATERVRMVHLLTHTAGLTYGFFRQHPVDAIYRANGLDGSGGLDLAALCDGLAAAPLLFQPGSEWAYSMATDVLGRVVEVLSGTSLPDFFATEIFGPLGMRETRFGAGAAPDPRLARLYSLTSAGLAPVDHLAAAVDRPAYPAGGGGLISSAHDYHRFTQMLLRGGELDGHRLLGPRTVAFMARNHLPGGADLAGYGRPVYSESPMRGIGFGLGFSVDLDPAAAGRPGSPGSYGWGGMAGTRFWVDPAEELTALFFTQAFTATPLPVREGLRQLVYQALVDRPPAPTGP